uniref:Uncharacterized protein n=1 Tax=Physcomitrium patens TaxID=3218 RepID=A0A2K1JXR5_PHYPA|nr:hypothetical protein PHYPA_013443 [Physcomitrium patens]
MALISILNRVYYLRPLQNKEKLGVLGHEYKLQPTKAIIIIYKLFFPNKV